MTILLMTKEGLYAARDRYGRTPMVIGKRMVLTVFPLKVSHTSISGTATAKELGPAEIVFITPDEIKTLSEPGDEMRICSFLWVYYGYPTSSLRRCQC